MKCSKLSRKSLDADWTNVSLVLVVLVMTSACSQLTKNSTPSTVQTSAARIEATAAQKICSAWPYTPYDSERDTPETVLGNKKNNAAKKSFCEE